MLDTVGRKAGIFGDYPSWDEGTGEGILALGWIDWFRLWGLPRNQEDILKRGSLTRSIGRMSFVLDLTSPVDVLESVQEAVPLNGTPMISNMLPPVVQNIDRLHWMYVPLSDEDPLARFVTRQEDSQWVTRVKTALQAEGIPYTRIVKEGGRETWHLGEELRRLCRLKSEIDRVRDNN